MMTILTNQQERTRFLRFSAVGAFGALVDFSVFNSADPTDQHFTGFGYRNLICGRGLQQFPLEPLLDLS